MSTGSKRGSETTVLAAVGVLLFAAACCATPLLIAAGAVGAAGVLGVIGSVLGNPRVIGVAVAGVAGAIAWLVLWRSRAKRRVDDCRVPEKPGSAQ